MINSHWVCKDHFPVAVFQFIWTFQTAKDLTEDRHQARRLLTRLPCVFFPPQDHRLQRLGKNKGSDWQKSAVQPTLPPHACPITHAHPHTQTRSGKFMMHVSILMCVLRENAGTHNCQQASPVESHIRPASLKKKISHCNGVFKNRIIH